MKILTDSLIEYCTHFSADKVVMLIMVIFMIIGGVDKLRGNKWKLGERFDAGFEAMGTLAPVVAGMIALSPVIKVVFGGILGKLFALIGCDPSIFAGLLLGTDLGGYPLAMELADTPSMGSFAGIVVASVMGINIVFSIPVGMGIIEEKDRSFLASGMLIGFATIPLGCIAGGLVMKGMGHDLSVLQILLNTVPVAFIALVIIAGLVVNQERLLKIFIGFGKGVNVVVICAIIVAVFQYLTGIMLPLFHVMVEENADGVVPLINGIEVVGEIALVLLGAFPMVTFITRKFSGPLRKLGGRVGLDEISVGGIIASVANNIPMFGMMKDMSPKGKIVNCAFTVSGAFVLGDHLGFCASVDQSMIIPMFAAKFAGGISALILALFLWKRFVPEHEG